MVFEAVLNARVRSPPSGRAILSTGPSPDGRASDTRNPENPFSMERIVFLERNPIPANFRRPNFDLDWIEYGETFAEQVVDRLLGATIGISNKLPLREAELSQLPKLKLIAIAATGSDNIDLDYCRKHGIAVSNARGYAVNSVPEHVLMMMLALRRNLLAYREDIQNGKWQQSKQFCLLTHELHDLNQSTLGIIGHGSIGKAMARL